MGLAGHADDVQTYCLTRLIDIFLRVCLSYVKNGTTTSVLPRHEANKPRCLSASSLLSSASASRSAGPLHQSLFSLKTPNKQQTHSHVRSCRPPCRCQVSFLLSRLPQAWVFGAESATSLPRPKNERIAKPNHQSACPRVCRYREITWMDDAKT